MSLVLNVELIGEYKRLTTATNGAKKQLSGLQKTAQNISSKINGAFAAIGVGLSFKFITDQLVDASKAAIEDRKSQELLADAMRNTMKASDDQIASVEKQIEKFSIATNTADDKLRPAYSKLIIATEDVTEANDLMAIALDTAAGTGKDLDTVAQAMAKALSGNDTALFKLLPKLRDAKDPLAELAKTFDGAAKAAADLDPYAKMQIIFDEMKEKVGTALLPKLDEFSQWLASPGGRERLEEIVDTLVDLVEEGVKVVDWVLKYKDALGPLMTGLGLAKIAVLGLQGAFGLATIASKLFADKSAADAARVQGAWAIAGGVIAAIGATGIVNQLLQSDRAEAQQSYEAAYNPISSSTTSTATGNMIVPAQKKLTAPPVVPITPVKRTMGTAVQQNITINNSKQTAAEIVKDLQKQGTAVGKRYIQ